MKNTAITSLIMFVMNVSFAQTNSTIYFKDGSNFYFSKAFNIANDSISLVTEKEGCIRVSLSLINKMYFFENTTRTVDSINTIQLHNGTQFKAKSAFRFTKTSVTINLSDGTVTILPIDQIDFFKVFTDSIYIKNNSGMRWSYGINASFNRWGKNLIGMQPEFFASYKLKNQLSFQISIGHYIMGNSAAYYSKIDFSNTFKSQPTSKQVLSDPNKKNNYKSIVFKGIPNNNLYCIGFKTLYYLFGTKVENAAGLGLNYYFANNNLKVNAASDWIRIDRKISLNDSIIQEPVMGKFTLETNYQIKPSLVFDAFYRIKYKLAGKIYLSNEIGILLGDLNFQFQTSSKSEFQYLTANIYNDQTEINNNYIGNKRLEFEQIYFKVGVIFN